MVVRGTIEIVAMIIGMMVNGELVRKPTQFMTNSPFIADLLRTRCDKTHDHTAIKGGNRSKQAQVYLNILAIIPVAMVTILTVMFIITILLLALELLMVQVTS